MSVFVQNILSRRWYLKRTWKDLAETVGEKPANIRYIVRKGNPTEAAIERMARVLGVPPHELINPNFDATAWPKPGGGENE